MIKKIKILTIFIVLFLLGSIFAQKAIAQEEEIIKFNSTVLVENTGHIRVLEAITYDFGSNQRHGIFRQIPYKKTNSEGKSFSLDISNISVSDDSGRSVKFNTSKDTGKGYLEVKIGDPDVLVTGQVYYEISYQISGALTYFEDQDEIYWNFTGNDWEVPILSSNNLVMYPQPADASDIKSACFTGALGSTDKNCQINTTDKAVIINSTQTLQPGEGISGVVGFPKGLAAVLEPKKDTSWVSALIFSSLFFLAATFWYVFIPLKTFFKRMSNKKFLDENKKIVAAWFDPPKDDDGKGYTPAETGVLIDKKPDHKEITGTIINLAQRGYIKILNDKKDFIFSKTKNYENDDFLTSYEKLILKGLFSDKDIISTKDLKTSTTFGKNITKFYTDVVSDLEKKKLFDKDLSNEKDKFVILNVLAGISMNILYLIVSFLTRNHYIKFSKKGVEKYSEAASLNNFLVSQDEKLDFQADRMMFFEKLLPYATAFGVEDVWAKRFKDLEFTNSDWYEGDISNAGSFTAISRSINNSVQSSVSHYSGGRSSSGFSSGFSGGGGSSGGGGGGGGGGSW